MFNFYDRKIADKITEEGSKIMNYYQREAIINDLLFQEGDKVKLPFGEEGVILKVADIPWGFKYLVNITKPTINNLGEELAFKFEQLTLITEK